MRWMNLEPIIQSKVRKIINTDYGSDRREFTCNVGDLSSIPGLRRSPGGGHGNSSILAWRIPMAGGWGLVGCSPWGRKDLDMTEQQITAEWLYMEPRKMVLMNLFAEQQCRHRHWEQIHETYLWMNSALFMLFEKCNASCVL